KRGEAPPLSMAVAPCRIDSKSPLTQPNSQLFMSGTKIFRREVSMFIKILGAWCPKPLVVDHHLLPTPGTFRCVSFEFHQAPALPLLTGVGIAQKINSH